MDLYACTATRGQQFKLPSTQCLIPKHLNIIQHIREHNANICPSTLPTSPSNDVPWYIPMIVNLHRPHSLLAPK